MLFGCRFGPQVVATGALDKTNRTDLDLNSVGRFGSGGKLPQERDFQLPTGRFPNTSWSEIDVLLPNSFTKFG